MLDPARTLSPEKLLLLQRRLKGGGGAGGGPRPAPLQPRTKPGPVPLSFAQHQMWVVDQMAPGSAAYNLPYGYRLTGSLNPDALAEAFDEVIQRHEILRTSFSVQDGEPIQVVHKPWSLKLNPIELNHLPAGQREAKLHESAATESGRPFDLTKLPLLRVSLFRLGDREHVLLINFHHIIADGLSISLLLKELDVCYRALSTGEKPILPDLPVQYSDFAAWERNETTTNDRLTQFAFWKNQLRGRLPLLELPWDKPRPIVPSYKGSSVLFELPAPLCGALQAVATAQGATFFMVILTAFYAILHRYSGATEIVVGTPVANRTMKEVQPLIGNFLNMLALRGDLSGDPSFNQLLRDSRDLALDAFSHSEVPFEQVAAQLHPPRDASRNLIFQTMLQVLPRDDPHLSDLKISDFDFVPVFAQFDLSLHLYERAVGYHGRFEYCTDLLKPETVERLAGHFQTLLKEIVADPEQPISTIPFLSDSERHQILAEWNDTAADYPRDVCVHELFEAQVKRTPQAVALVFGEKSLTYHELNARAEALSGVLRERGVGPDVRVGLCVERSFDLVVGILGILKAGGAYVPIDPSYPADRIAFVLEDSRTSVVVTQHALLARLPPTTASFVLLDQPLPPVTGSVTAEPVRATHLAYVLYTSGSTGKPKGVQIEHRAIVNFLHSMRREPGLNAQDTLLAVTTLSFDIAGLELHLPLTTGARVIIAPREVSADGQALLHAIERHGVTVLQATPATWRLMLDAGWQGTPQLKALCGGEPLPADLARALLPRCAELWNMYGPTETTIWSTCCRVTDPTDIHIGRPIDNTEIFILDAHQAPLPVGLAGELLIGGDGLARSYWERPELTAEKFIANPFKPGHRLYRTGDLARYRSDGNIECLGRLDFQVKIRGFRIELGEIENQLVSHPQVQQAVVMARADLAGNKRMVAYVVAHSTAAPSPADLRAYLHRQLADYMIPGAFVFLEALPLTPNGKVDRKALPEPDNAASPEVRYEAPHGPTEERLAAIMATLLHLPKVGRSDDFFALGGNSILAVTLFNEIDRAFAKRIPLATLFNAPTIEHLATVLAAEPDRSRDWASLVPIQPQGTQPRFFCVHGAGGNVLLYRDLVRALGTDYPFYGLQSQGLNRPAARLKTIEEMAERYIREIRELQREGPYCIGGYCMGGTIAYEMAQQLRANGQQVAFVAMLDTYNFTRMEKTKPLHYLRQKIWFHLGNLSQLSWKDLPGYLSNKLRTASDGELSALWKTVGVSWSHSHSQKGSLPTEAGSQAVNDEAGDAYRPKPYAGHVVVFKPKINYDFLPDPKMGWSDMVGSGLEIVELPVNPHAMLVEPFVVHLAAELKRQIARVAQKKAG